MIESYATYLAVLTELAKGFPAANPRSVKPGPLSAHSPDTGKSLGSRQRRLGLHQDRPASPPRHSWGWGCLSRTST